jgi:acetyl-CoA C-acetyltransferase
MKEVFIVSGVRTALGSFQGSLAEVPTVRLGATVVAEAAARANVPKEAVDDLIMGCVLPGGLGQAPARQSCIYGGFPEKVRCLTINKVCGSGLKSVMLAAAAIRSGDSGVAIAGGMENMSLTPYVLHKARTGLRMGNANLVDMMVNDGLWDPYNDYHMGMAAELCASEMGISREDQDAYAIRSYQKAVKAVQAGEFDREIVAVEIKDRKGNTQKIDKDEEPFKANLDKLPSLKPAFKKDGTVTAANASSINDGAAAVLLADEDAVKRLGLQPRFRVVGYAEHSQKPEWFTTAPSQAIKNLWARIGWTDKDVDLYEINEAFAVVALANNRLAGIDESKVNLRGGAVALGHPIGASGARVLVTLMHLLEDRKMRRGICSLCNGGGEAPALAIERL